MVYERFFSQYILDFKMMKPIVNVEFPYFKVLAIELVGRENRTKRVHIHACSKSRLFKLLDL